MKTGVMSSAMMAFAMMSGDPQERAHEPKQGKGKESSNAIFNYGAINAPINLQNNSQKAKRKVLLASNKKQGRN
jgi:hypothetical protein